METPGLLVQPVRTAAPAHKAPMVMPAPVVLRAPVDHKVRKVTPLSLRWHR